MVINRKFTVKRSLVFLTGLVLGATPLCLIEKPAFAGCGWGDITCDPRNWDRLPIPIPGSSGGSTGAVAVAVDLWETQWFRLMMTIVQDSNGEPIRYRKIVDIILPLLTMAEGLVSIPND